MQQLEYINDIKEGSLICIDSESGIFNGYVIDLIESDVGLIHLILADSDKSFLERTFLIECDENGLITQPIIFNME